MNENRSPKGLDGSDPRVQQRRALQLASNAKISERQRPVLPEGYNCALWSFQIPWAPFEYYLQNPCPETKPFLWSETFHVNNSEWMLFFGVEPMESEGGRSSMWIGVCNNLPTPITAYTRIDLYRPNTVIMGGSDLELVGEDIDTLNPCGQVQNKNKFGKFWWHKTPSDFARNLFNASGDDKKDKSFELLLTIRLDVKQGQSVNTANPNLWETSCKYLQPWVSARLHAVKAPYEDQIAQLEKEIQRQKERCNTIVGEKEAELKSAKEREDSARGDAIRLEAKLTESRLKEKQLQATVSKLENKMREQEAREKQLHQTIQRLEQKLKQSIQNVEELRKWGAQLQQQLKESAAREEILQTEKTRLEDYIKNTAIREERLTNAIKELESQLKSGKLNEDRMMSELRRLQHNVTDYREREDMLRASNSRLYQANTDEKV